MTKADRETKVPAISPRARELIAMARADYERGEITKEQLDSYTRSYQFLGQRQAAGLPSLYLTG